MRNHSFDALKGGLIVLVICGHVLIGTLEENGIRRFIYFFHMPLFLAVTGYFVKRSVIERPFIWLARRYYHRMILPFLVAFVVFTGILWVEKYRLGELTIERIAGSFLYPYFHLWYIPAVLVFMVYTKMFERLRLRIEPVLLAALAITVLFESIGAHLEETHEALLLIGDKRFYYYYVYFLVGYAYANHHPVYARRLVLQCSLVALFGMAYTFLAGNPWLSGLVKVWTNLLLINVCLALCEARPGRREHFLSQVGRHSLPIYLWHVLPLIVLWRIPASYAWFYYACASLVMLSCIFFFLQLKGRFRMMERLFYGAQARSTYTDTRTPTR